MPLRRKRVFVFVVGLGGLALVVDSLTRPDTVDGSQPLATGPAHSAVPDAPLDGAAPSIPELPFPDGLESYVLGPEVRDLFAPPIGRPSKDESRPGSDKRMALSAGHTGSDAVGRTVFASRHTLGAVLVDERLRIAIVDGRWMREGQRLDGCELIEVAENNVRFSCYDGVTTLTLVEYDLDTGR